MFPDFQKAANQIAVHVIAAGIMSVQYDLFPSAYELTAVFITVLAVRVSGALFESACRFRAFRYGIALCGVDVRLIICKSAYKLRFRCGIALLAVRVSGTLFLPAYQYGGLLIALFGMGMFAYFIQRADQVTAAVIAPG